MASAAHASSTGSTGDELRNPTPGLSTDLRIPERLAAEYWAERDGPLVGTGPDQRADVAVMEKLCLWQGSDLRDAEAQLQVALGETMSETLLEHHVCVGLVMLMTSALLTIRRVRNAQTRENSRG